MRSQQPISKISNKVASKDQDRFIKNQNTCPLCDSHLNIKTTSHLIEPAMDENTITEEASCPKCQLVARVKDHRIH